MTKDTDTSDLHAARSHSNYYVSVISHVISHETRPWREKKGEWRLYNNTLKKEARKTARIDAKVNEANGGPRSNNMRWRKFEHRCEKKNSAWETSLFQEICVREMCDISLGASFRPTDREKLNISIVIRHLSSNPNDTWYHHGSPTESQFFWGLC